MKAYLVIIVLLLSSQVYGQTSQEEVYDIVEVIPKYPSGMGGFYTFIYQQLAYPEGPKSAGI